MAKKTCLAVALLGAIVILAGSVSPAARKGPTFTSITGDQGPAR